MYTVLDFSKTIVAKALHPGSIAIDATMGNGYDTVFLAQHVGHGGKVYAFDVQSQALEATKKRLEEAGVATRVMCLLQGHETLAEALPPEVAGQVDAVMFNLGYLPGGRDKTKTTHPETTIRALNAACTLLSAGGVISVVLYEGHPGGVEEAEAVRGWSEGLDAGRYDVVAYRYLNRAKSPPWFLGIEKRR